MGADGADAVQHALLELALAERRLHLAADFLPALAAHARMHAAVGDDLHVMIRQQQINQHAVVVFRIPHAQMREHLERAMTRRLAA